MVKFIQIASAAFVGATASLLTINGLTAAHHNYWAHQWSKTCDFRPVALFQAQKAAELNPIHGQALVAMLQTKGC